MKDIGAMTFFKIFSLSGQAVRCHCHKPPFWLKEPFSIKWIGFFKTIEHKIKSDQSFVVANRLDSHITAVMAISQVHSGRPANLTSHIIQNDDESEPS